MGKALNRKEYEELSKWEKKNGVTPTRLILEAMARGFQSLKEDNGEYKRAIDLQNNSYLIIPHAMFPGRRGSNRDPILIYPKPYQFSINDEKLNYVGYHKSGMERSYSHFSIWDAWKLMDCYCIPRVANKHKGNNISKELKRKRKRN